MYLIIILLGCTPLSYYHCIVRPHPGRIYPLFIDPRASSPSPHPSIYPVMSTVELGKVVDIVQEESLTDTFNNFLDEHLPRADEEVPHHSEYPPTPKPSNFVGSVTVLKVISPNESSTTCTTMCAVDQTVATVATAPEISVVVCEDSYTDNQSISGMNVFYQMII